MQTRRRRDVGHPDGPLVVCSHEGGHAFGVPCPAGGRHVRFRMKGMAWLTVGGLVPGQPQEPRLQFEQNGAPRPSGLKLPWQRLVQQVCSAFKARRVGRIGVGLRDGASSQSRLNQPGRRPQASICSSGRVGQNIRVSAVAISRCGVAAHSRV